MKLKIKAAIFGIAAAMIVLSASSTFGQQNELVGSWKNASVGMISYQNRTTGATKPGRGSIFTYKFLPNGNYEFVGYMESTMYNFTTTLFNDIKGKYRVEGNVLHLSPTRDFWKSGNTCAASANKEQTKTPVEKSMTFATLEDEYGATLLCLTEGESESCFRREEG